MKDIRKWLQAKRDSGASRVAVDEVLAALDEIEANGGGLPRLMGTAEAADYLGVERTRIGKWLNTKYMPKPAARLKAGPVWTFAQLRPLKGEVKKRRRAKKS